MECFANVSRHGYIDVLAFVVPCQGQAAIKCACHVCCNFVLFAECVMEVVDVRDVFIFDTKVVHDQGRRNWQGVVFPHAWGVLDRLVFVWCKVLLEAAVGYFPGMG